MRTEQKKRFFNCDIFQKKNGNILTGNIVFILLNLVFLAILILFLLKQGSGAVVLEMSYAKQIALLVDCAKSDTTIKLNMGDAKALAEDNKIGFDKIIKIEGNIVTVKLSEKSGYSYSFFNDVEVDAYPGENKDKDFYIFTIN